MSTNESFSLHICSKASFPPCNYPHQLVFTFSQLWPIVFFHMLWNMIHIWKHFTLCNYMGSELLTPVTSSGTTFLDVMCLTEVNRHSGKTYYLHLQDCISNLSKQITYCLLGLLFNFDDGGSTFLHNVCNFYQTKWHHIIEGSISTLQLKAIPVTGRGSPPRHWGSHIF